jgi:methyl-accepting chemotaxis protein
MSGLDRFSIKFRLMASFGLVLALMAVVIGVGAWGGQRTQNELQALIGQELRKYELVADIDSATKSNARNTLELFLAPPGQRPAIRQRMTQARNDIDARFAQLDTLLYLPEGRSLFNDIKSRRAAYVAAFTDAATALEQAGPDAGLVVLHQRVLPAIDALAQPLQALLDLQKKVARQRGQDAENQLHRQNTLNIGLGVLALTLGLGAAWSLVVSIMAPLTAAKTVTRAIAAGDLTVNVPISGRNELSELMQALQQMKESLGQVLQGIQENTGTVACASSQIAAANLDLSGRTEEQASALQQTAATMEELTSTVHQNAQTTGAARTLAEQASRSAQEVGDIVTAVVGTMQDIHASSQRIRDIVSVIDSIAFQTNILALNAAVEAARAGEQGRGFAVVASEVRALAQRSASAAQEIKVIIEDNVARMDAGNREALRAGEAVEASLHHIERVNQTIAEVDLASREQSTGIGQVGEAVSQMDQVTQQNAALVEETAAATQNLDDQVQGLKNQLARFKLHASSGGLQTLGPRGA